MSGSHDPGDGLDDQSGPHMYYSNILAAAARLSSAVPGERSPDVLLDSSGSLAHSAVRPRSRAFRPRQIAETTSPGRARGTIASVPRRKGMPEGEPHAISARLRAPRPEVRRS